MPSDQHAETVDQELLPEPSRWETRFWYIMGIGATLVVVGGFGLIGHPFDPSVLFAIGMLIFIAGTVRQVRK